jgi:hypothetical protein
MSSSAELVEAVPYLLGFHPSDSLVAVGFRRSADPTGPPLAMAVTARTDLDPADETGLDQPSAAAMLRALRDAGCEAVIVVLFPAELPAGPASHPRADPVVARLTLMVTELLNAAGIMLLEALLVYQDRWWSLSCEDDDCCPPEGNPREAGSSVAAELTYAGLVARPDRATLLATLDGDDEADRAALLPALHRADQRLLELLGRKGANVARRTESSALARAAQECEQGVELSRRRLARLGAALRDIPIRDALWVAIDARTITPTALLTQLHKALPAPYDATPMFLFGWANWRAGVGTLASEAAERALHSDPGCSAARLLLEAVQSGMDPHTTPSLQRP